MMCPCQVAQLPLIEAGSTATVSARLTVLFRHPERGGSSVWQNGEIIRLSPGCSLVRGTDDRQVCEPVDAPFREVAMVPVRSVQGRRGLGDLPVLVKVVSG